MLFFSPPPLLLVTLGRQVFSFFLSDTIERRDPHLALGGFKGGGGGARGMTVQEPAQNLFNSIFFAREKKWRGQYFSLSQWAGGDIPMAGVVFFHFFLLAIFFWRIRRRNPGGDIMKGAPENDDPSFLCRPVNRGGGGEGRKRKKFPRIRGAPPPPQRQLRK